MAAENGQYGRSVVSEKETEARVEGVQSGFPFCRNERQRKTQQRFFFLSLFSSFSLSLCIYIFHLHMCQHISLFFANILVDIQVKPQIII